METYPNNRGMWEERDGIRSEVFHDGSWAVYTTAGPFRSIASADTDRGTNIQQATTAAATARQQLQR
jgi:hypothetical protein